jgi:hypothetical protein
MGSKLIMGYDGKNYPGTNPSTPFHYPNVEGMNVEYPIKS